MASIIKVQNLRKVYRVGKEKVVALDDICLEIGEGEMCCIVGASGSGKSTLLNQLAGLEKPTKGRVLIGKHDISAMTEDELADFRQQHLGFIFQSYNLLPSMTAAENVALPLMFKGMGKKQREKLARKELKKMGLLSRANHKPTEMSGGQQQRAGQCAAGRRRKSGKPPSPVWRCNERGYRRAGNDRCRGKKTGSQAGKGRGCCRG